MVTKMPKNEELLAKNVFGELTLRDIIRHFTGKIESFHIYSEDDATDLSSKDWGMNEENLQFYGEYEMDFEFDLNSKIKVREDELEVEQEGKTYILTIHQKADFSPFIPRRKNNDSISG